VSGLFGARLCFGVWLLTLALASPEIALVAGNLLLAVVQGRGQLPDKVVSFSMRLAFVVSRVSDK
jgi:hypothetical protein